MAARGAAGGACWRPANDKKKPSSHTACARELCLEFLEHGADKHTVLREWVLDARVGDLFWLLTVLSGCIYMHIYILKC